MQEIKIIGFDLDGVIVEKKIKISEIKELLEEFQKKREEIDVLELLKIAGEYPFLLQLVKEKEINSEKMKKVKTEGLKLVEEINEAEYPSLAKFLLTSRWWKSLLFRAQPVKNIEIFRKICQGRYQVHIISRRLSSDLPAIKKWLKDNGIEIKKIHFHLRPNLDISEIEFKKEVVEKNKIEAFYDDLEWVVEKIPRARIFKSWLQVKRDLNLR